MLWQGYAERLAIKIKDNDDWSFNKKNISDVIACGRSLSRDEKDDADVQEKLDELYTALKKVSPIKTE